MGGFWKAFTAWLDQPFKQPVSAWELFLGIGLIIVILVLWQRIIKAIGEAI